MKIIMLLVSLVSLTQGRPKYYYPKPSGKYGTPSVGQISTGVFSDGGNSAYESYNGGYSSSAYKGYNGGYSGIKHVDSGTTLVHKHIYVHAPPPEFDESQSPHHTVVLPPPEKHYKIIFIKAPSAASPVAPVVAQPEKEEKTLVYVLVKKPEEAPVITVPTAAPTLPSKPEVYFIRYKAKTATPKFEEPTTDIDHIGEPYTSFDSAGLSSDDEGVPSSSYSFPGRGFY